MLRAIVSLCLSVGLLAHTADVLACEPSPSQYLVPTALLTDISRPVARDAGIYFSSEVRAMHVPDPAFAVEVKNASSGEVVAGSLDSLPLWLGARVLAWVPEQPLAATTTYEISVTPQPLKPRPEKDVDTMKYPPVKELQASFTTSGKSISKLELDAEPRISLRVAKQVPRRCAGCGLMDSMCGPTQVLLADIELPAVVGGAEKYGFELTAEARYAGIPQQREADERTHVQLIDARKAQVIAFEVLESPEPSELCVGVTIRDLSKQSVSSAPVCFDADEVAAAIRGERHVEACGVVVPGAGSGGRASWWIPLGLLLALRRRFGATERTGA